MQYCKHAALLVMQIASECSNSSFVCIVAYQVVMLFISFRGHDPRCCFLWSLHIHSMAMWVFASVLLFPTTSQRWGIVICPKCGCLAGELWIADGHVKENRQEGNSWGWGKWKREKCSESQHELDGVNDFYLLLKKEIRKYFKELLKVNHC